eukprot:TRINITY_DN16162_c0_g1_i1.p1 TRINITY_DN16162_c0_g1~~TRINITY_DN16162_c0_g1_i1.p1  ORF type:complete len:172 (-),score=21.20 TRINITY_DN16162_c0_g1_i1:181-696(-)
MGPWLGLTSICLIPLLLPWYISLVRYIKPATMVEEITLPARFVTTAAHLVCSLTVFYDADNIVLQALDINATEPQVHKHRTELLALSAISMVCFVAEFLGTFSGVSLFLPKINGLYIWLHFVGAVLLSFFVSQHWELTWFVYIVVFCNIVPTLVEICVAFALFKLKLMEYS